MAEEKHTQRTILLVDDEANITSALKRTLRRDGYNILTANSGVEGLNLLAIHEVGVIISDQRMPQMTGVEFLRKVKTLYPKTFRMVLSGYTELESVTSAINEGAIYKFLTKPWDDELLRDNIREAFEFYEMELENQRLSRELQHSNDELFRLNQNLEQQVIEKTREIVHNINMLEISQEILEHLPVAIIGIDEYNMTAASNRRADELFRSRSGGCLLGLQASEYLPETLLRALQQTPSVSATEFNGSILHLENDNVMHVWVSPMGDFSRSKGTIIVLSPLRKIDVLP
jgi:response regulator RpfG family c-di-GMP phosphodiesterase